MSQETEWITKSILESSSIHIFGCGLKSEKPAHRAIHDLYDRGWRLVPIHPKDAGASIRGLPIRPDIDRGINPEIMVLFLSPEQSLEVIKKSVIRYGIDDLPLIWLQRGAQSEQIDDILSKIPQKLVKNDCIVEYITRNNLFNSKQHQPVPWFRQIKDKIEYGCSLWEYYEASNDADIVTTELEWVGDLQDLQQSKHTVARYVRSLQNEDENILQLGKRLSLDV